MEIFRPDIGARIFLPGDADDKASIEAEVQNPADKEIQKVAPMADKERGPYAMMATHFMFAPFVIPEPGLIKVRILRDGVLHRIGSLMVRELQTASVSSAP
jgi:hypothetical protein